jgi:orotidine-5'-phosphate decarboxylase
MTRIPANKKIILAYDKSDYLPADYKFLSNAREIIGGVKIGLETATACTPDNPVPVFFRMLPDLIALGYDVMADWKLPDTPNTNGRAMKNLAAWNVWGVTMKADSGPASIAACVENRGNAHVIGVTVLTSILEKECKRIFGSLPRGAVINFADMLVEHKATAIVCSPLELEVIRCKPLLSMTPGIRDKNDPPDDQKRTMPAVDAIKAGADRIVVGRPITGKPDPLAAAAMMLDDIVKAESNLSMV